jgi:hypothetical protein
MTDWNLAFSAMAENDRIAEVRLPRPLPSGERSAMHATPAEPSRDTRQLC